MSNCKDCAHFPVCNRESALRVGGCELFKDKDRLVELPCEVGDTVYVIENGNVIEDFVDQIGIGYYADGVNLYQFEGVKTDGYFEDFGKTVFLTREEAERALKNE